MTSIHQEDMDTRNKTKTPVIGTPDNPGHPVVTGGGGGGNNVPAWTGGDLNAVQTQDQPQSLFGQAIQSLVQNFRGGVLPPSPFVYNPDSHTPIAWRGTPLSAIDQSTGLPKYQQYNTPGVQDQSSQSNYPINPNGNSSVPTSGIPAYSQKPPIQKYGDSAFVPDSSKSSGGGSVPAYAGYPTTPGETLLAYQNQYNPTRSIVNMTPAVPGTPGGITVSKTVAPGTPGGSIVNGNPDPNYFNPNATANLSGYQGTGKGGTVNFYDPDWNNGLAYKPGGLSLQEIIQNNNSGEGRGGITTPDGTGIDQSTGKSHAGQSSSGFGVQTGNVYVVDKDGTRRPWDPNKDTAGKNGTNVDTLPEVSGYYQIGGKYYPIDLKHANEWYNTPVWQQYLSEGGTDPWGYSRRGYGGGGGGYGGSSYSSNPNWYLDALNWRI